MKIDIGINSTDRKEIAQGLSHFLADAYTLYLKTHNFHWNITGPMFNSLHTMFETQYTEQWTALDEIAERIRALGFNAPGSYAETDELLRANGCEPVLFDPALDTSLPPGTSGLYLGGGFPEAHAPALSRNTALTGAVRDAIASGMPTVADVTYTV